MWATRIDIEGETFHTLGMVVQLAPDQEEFLLQRVRSGRFATMDEAVREAVGLLKEQEAGNIAKLAAGRKSLAQLFAESPFRGMDSPSGADLVAAMQASPYKDISLEPARDRMPVRDVTF